MRCASPRRAPTGPCPRRWRCRPCRRPAADGAGRGLDEIGGGDALVGLDRGDEAHPAGRRLAEQHHAADAGLLSDRDREIAQVARLDAVDPFDDDAVLGGRGELGGASGRQLGPERLDLGLERLDLVELALHAVDHVAGLPDELSDLTELTLVALQQLDRRRPGQGLDPAQVGADRRLADDLDGADVAGGAHVRAAAELDRGAGLEDADDVAVLVAEERDRAHRFGLGLARLERSRPLVAEGLGVDEPLDLVDLLGGDRVVMREVEPEPIGADVGAGLLDVIAEHPAQRPVQQVGRGVVAAGGVTPLDVDPGGRLLPGADGAAGAAHDVAAQVGEGERGVDDLE